MIIFVLVTLWGIKSSASLKGPLPVSELRIGCQRTWLSESPTPSPTEVPDGGVPGACGLDGSSSPCGCRPTCGRRMLLDVTRAEWSGPCIPRTRVSHTHACCSCFQPPESPFQGAWWRSADAGSWALMLKGLSEPGPTGCFWCRIGYNSLWYVNDVIPTRKMISLQEIFRCLLFFPSK